MPYKSLQRLFLNSALLAFESQLVVGLRLSRFALGGPGAGVEAQRMVTEKVAAAIEAAGTLASGGSPHRVFKGYRRKVRANARRLRKG